MDAETSKSEKVKSEKVTRRKGKGATPIAKGVEIAPARPIFTTRVVVKVTALRPGQQQYRTRFEERAMADLTESIRRTGVQSAPWVRTASDGDGYELIAGERRWRAACAAGLEEVAVDIKSYADGERLDDEMALELSVIENSQRSDPHPLEELDAFIALRDQHGHSAEQIAAKIKRSPGYVYERLALEGLGEEGRAAMWAGRLPLGAGHALSRLHRSTQGEAVIELLRDVDDDESVSVAHARREILRRWTLRIVSAPFPTSDVDLVPSAGACTTCPKRSGNQGVLFESGLGREDVCTDVRCWASKRAASDLRIIEEARANGATVISKEESKQHFSYGDNLSSRSWIALDGTDYALTAGKPWREVIGTKRLAEVARAYLQAPSGTLVEVAKRSNVLAVLKATPAKTDTPGIIAMREHREASTHDDKERSAHSEHAIDARARELAMTQLAAQVERGEHAPDRAAEISKAVTIGLALSELGSGDRDDSIRLFREYGVYVPRYTALPQIEQAVAEALGELSLARCRALLVRLAAKCVCYSEIDIEGRLLAIAEIDPSAFRAAAEVALEVERVARKAQSSADDEGEDDDGTAGDDDE